MLRKLSVLCLIAAAFALVQPAAADPGRGADVLCYLWANLPTNAIGAPYTPSPTYSYNSVGRASANIVTRTGIGQYTVTCQGVGGGALFAKQGEELATPEESVSTNAVARSGGDEIAPQSGGSWGAGGHVQVSAYGSEDADHCKTTGWSTGSRDFTAFVRCYNHAGALSDSRFDLLFVW